MNSYYRDGSAAVVRDGVLVAAIETERLTVSRSSKWTQLFSSAG